MTTKTAATIGPCSRIWGLGLGEAMVPVTFLLLWSTGYISARLGLPYAEPFTFLSLRYAAVAAILVALCLLTSAPWPRRPREILMIGLVGCLINGVFLGGIFVSISFSVPSSVAALIVGTQPVLTAIGAAVLLGERQSPGQWFGQVLGLAGVALVIERKLDLDVEGIAGIAACLVALAAMTAGTLLQKRYCAAMDLRSGAAIQFGAATLLTGLLALLFETRHVEWSGEFVIALSSLIFVSSLGATTLLYVLIRRGAASRVSSLFYLVPAIAAVLEWAIFGETFGWLTVLGMALAAVGVLMITRPKPAG